MPVVVVGVNHKTAPVAVRERLAFADQTLAEVPRPVAPPCDSGSSYALDV